jgi:exosortase
MTALTRALAFVASAAVVVVAGMPTLHQLVVFALANETSSHTLIVPLVSAGLIYQERQTIFASVTTAPMTGGFLILAGLAVRFAGEPTGNLTIATASLVILVIGGFVLWFGPRAFRAAVFPLLFLGFMIPVPNNVLQSATHFLKSGSRMVVSGLFMATGTPFYREGFVFSLPEFTIEIADECSGIRSSIALLLTGLLAGHLYLKNPWKKLSLAIAVIPIALIKNGMRIVTLTLLASHVDPGFLRGQLHHEGGIVFFMIAMAILSPLFIALRNSELA